MQLIELNYPLDRSALLMEAEQARERATPYSDVRFPGLQLNQWHVVKYNSVLIQKIADDFGVTAKPRFYFHAPFFELPEHVDHNTTCSINFVLSDDPAPVTIGGRELVYKQCLLNTTIPHSVKNGPKERILLKLSIFDISFEELAGQIRYRV